MTKLHGLARLFRVAGVAVALAAIGSVAVAETFIVENGQPNAEIVIAEDPPRMTKLAAEELRDIVEKISDARLPIANAPGGAAVQIYVGKSPHTERLGVTDEGLVGEGYRTVSGENWLVLIGQDADYEPKEPDVAGMEITATEDGDTRIWNSDCIEILIETQSHSYYQFAVSPAGALVDVDRKRGINTTWSSGAEVATHIGEDFWSAEIRIPLAGDMQADLNPDFGVSGRTPSNTQPWHFNILRQRKRDGSAEHLVFSPLGDRGFHDIMTFGKLYRP